MREHWRHLADTIEPVLPAASSPQPKSIGSAIFAQIIAEGPYTLQWCPFPPTLPLPMGDLDPSNLWFLEPVRVHSPNGITIGSAVFA